MVMTKLIQHKRKARAANDDQTGLAEDKEALFAIIRPKISFLVYACPADRLAGAARHLRTQTRKLEARLPAKIAASVAARWSGFGLRVLVVAPPPKQAIRSVPGGPGVQGRESIPSQLAAVRSWRDTRAGSARCARASCSRGGLLTTARP